MLAYRVQSSESGRSDNTTSGKTSRVRFRRFGRRADSGGYPLFFPGASGEARDRVRGDTLHGDDSPRSLPRSRNFGRDNVRLADRPAREGFDERRVPRLHRYRRHSDNTERGKDKEKGIEGRETLVWRLS